MSSKAMMQTIEASIVSTKNYVFIVPQKTTGMFIIVDTIKRHNLFAGVSIPDGVQKIIASCKTVEELESSMRNLLEDKELYVYNISALTSFKFRGFLGKQTVRLATGLSWTSISPANKAESKAFRAFHGQ